MYCRMMGPRACGNHRAAILSANYISARLADHYPTCTPAPTAMWRTSAFWTCARSRETSGVMAGRRGQAPDRLRLSRAHAELSRCPHADGRTHRKRDAGRAGPLHVDAMIAIREEIRRVESGEWPQDDNPLKNAPHTAEPARRLTGPHPTARNRRLPFGQPAHAKYWAPVGRWTTSAATATCSAAACR